MIYNTNHIINKHVQITQYKYSYLHNMIQFIICIYIKNIHKYIQIETDYKKIFVL